MPIDDGPVPTPIGETPSGMTAEGEFRPAEGETSMAYVWVAMGGALGAMTRYGLGNAMAGRWGREFPWGTLAINVTGSLLIGVILTWLVERGVGASTWRPLIVVGVLGGYTTFSAFSFEVVTLVDDGRVGRAATYAGASVVLGVAACAVGVAVARVAMR